MGGGEVLRSIWLDLLPPTVTPLAAGKRKQKRGIKPLLFCADVANQALVRRARPRANKLNIDRRAAKSNAPPLTPPLEPLPGGVLPLEELELLDELELLELEELLELDEELLLDEEELEEDELLLDATSAGGVPL